MRESTHDRLFNIGFIILIAFLFFFIIATALAQTTRANFLGGYDVTVDVWEQGALCSY